MSAPHWFYHRYEAGGSFSRHAERRPRLVFFEQHYGLVHIPGYSYYANPMTGTCYFKQKFELVGPGGDYGRVLASHEGRMPEAQMGEWIAWAKAFDALEPQRLEEEREREAQEQAILDAQEKRAVQAELLRRNGPRIVKILRDVYPMLRQTMGAEIEALFRDLGEDINATTAAVEALKEAKP